VAAHTPNVIEIREGKVENGTSVFSVCGMTGEDSFKKKMAVFWTVALCSLVEVIFVLTAVRTSNPT
jgi:hypothetical protein